VGGHLGDTVIGRQTTEKLNFGLVLVRYRVCERFRNL